jgi:hypothetical protein
MSTQHTRYVQASPPVAALVDFRAGFFRCLTGWADAAFELCDAALCAPAPAGSVPTLSLEPTFRRSHGSLYKVLSLGRVDHEQMRDLLPTVPNTRRVRCSSFTATDQPCRSQDGPPHRPSQQETASAAVTDETAPNSRPP